MVVAENSDLSELLAQKVALVQPLKVTSEVFRPWHLLHLKELIELTRALSSTDSEGAEACWGPVVSSTEASEVVD